MKHLMTIGLVLSLAACMAGCSDGEDAVVSNNCVGGCGNEGGPELFGPADDTDWVSFRDGPLRTGVATDAVLGDDVREVWRRDDFFVLDYSAVKPSGVVWGDSLYYPSDGGVMWAFDRHTGGVRWSTPLTDAFNGIHGSPAVTRSTVMIGTYGGWLHALDRH